MNGSGFIKEIGRSYVVSSGFPAALFVLIAAFLFQGFIPKTITERLNETSSYFGFRWMIIFILVAWLAFYLYSSVDWTVKFFEGYFFPKFLQNLMVDSLGKKWFEKHAPKYTRLKTLKDAGVTEESKQEFINLRSYALIELQDLEIKSPLEKGLLMPTRLGNVLRASELYAYERYKLESITLWPRLFNVLPADFVRKLEEKNNHLIFLLNSSFLAILLGSISSALGFIRFPCQLWPTFNSCIVAPEQRSFFARGFSAITPFEFIIIGFFLIGFGYLLYSISVNAAEDYGLFIRSGYDLYRFNLLEQLYHELPKSLGDEQPMWEALTEFMIAGNRLGMKEIKFDYVESEQDNSDVKGRGAGSIKK